MTGIDSRVWWRKGANAKLCLVSNRRNIFNAGDVIGLMSSKMFLHLLFIPDKIYPQLYEKNLYSCG